MQPAPEIRLCIDSYYMLIYKSLVWTFLLYFTILNGLLKNYILWDLN